MHLCLSQTGPLCQVCVAKIAPEILKPSDKINIFVRTQSGRSYKLTIELSSTVNDVKERSLHLLPWGIPVKKVALVFKKKILEDERTLLSYNGIGQGLQIVYFYLLKKFFGIFIINIEIFMNI